MQRQRLNWARQVLFLDIDGVVQTDTPGRISQLLLRYIKQIVDATGCSIVLSSDWRRAPQGRAAVSEALRQQGLHFIDHTPQSRCHRPQSLADRLGSSNWVAERPAEIVAWIRGFNAKKASQQHSARVTHFVAIDDRSLLEETGGEHLRGHFCQTQPRVGMNPERVRVAIECLNRKLSPEEEQELSGTTGQGQALRGVRSTPGYFSSGSCHRWAGARYAYGGRPQFGLSQV